MVLSHMLVGHQIGSLSACCAFVIEGRPLLLSSRVTDS